MIFQASFFKSSSFQVSINSTPAVVFSLLNNPQKRQEWAPGLEETVYTHKPEG